MTDTQAPPLPIGVTSTQIPVRGGSVHMLEGGPLEGGPTEGADASPILFLHAAGGAGVWLPLHQSLAAGARVLAPDHPGFAGSDELEDVEGVDDLVIHYLDLLDDLGIEGVRLVGVSFGGWVAAELAVAAGSRIDKLVLIDPIGLRVPGEPIADLFAMSPEQSMAALFHDPSKAAGFFPPEPDLDFVIKMVSDQTAFARFAWEPFCCNPKLERRLHRISAPTLVLWGESDHVVPRAHGDRYVSGIPDARFEVLPQTGHAAHMESPELCFDAITAFLGQP